MNHSICLNMIVKNESHVIKSTLENLCKYINFSYYVISDTGSTDNTQQIIKDFFDSKNIEGLLFFDEWKDFGYNRTLALNHAYKKTDYLYIFDADDSIYGDLKIPDNLSEDAYFLKFGNNTTYKRILLINNHLKWQFKGVLHEYIECIEKNKTLKFGDINGNYYIDSGKTGNRSIDPQKYMKDALILEKAFYEAEKNNDDLKIRYSFYNAQSYRDHNEKEKSIEWYKKRASFGGWNQEMYYSYYMIGNLYYDINQIPNAIYYWSLAIEEDNERYETIYQIITHFRKNNLCFLAYQYYLMIKNKNPNLKDKLFATYTIYSFLLDYELTIILYNNKKFSEAINSFYNLFSRKIDGSLDINILLNIFDNFRFYAEHVDLNIDFIHTFYNFINELLKKNRFSYERINYLKNITHHITKKYNNPSVNLKKNIDNPTIFLSITTCKRYDLFVKTMNSLLTCFKDINLVDYFFCIDDNSTQEDRSNMIKNYPFFDFYLKEENEKGHLASMNIIWNKLNELKPKYWIHIEDDWLFFKPDHYIIKSIKFLEKYQSLNISQILFNKNYAETFDDIDIVGGKKLDEDFILHIKDEPNLNGKNCAYWPHYSFRPSVCFVDTILKLGNYDSSLTFFERTYADKYFLNGYQSAFFNEITCIHIGKLTKEINNKNAYQLNNIDQFNNTNNLISYIFIKNKDHYGDDIEFKPNLSLHEMISIADKNENILAFNTLGYFKYNINIDTLIDFNISNSNNNEIGIFINMLRYNKSQNLIQELIDRKMIDANINKEINDVNEDIIIENIKEDTKEDTKEEINDVNEDIIIENIKEDTKEDTKEEINDVNEDIIIENIKEDIKEDTKEDNKEEINDVNEEINAHEKVNITPQIVKDISNSPIFMLQKDNVIDNLDCKLKIPFITIIDNYLFIKNKDYPNYDIDFKSNLSINEMIKIANENPKCKAFNTLGFFKNNINLNQLVSNQFINRGNNGIFIKIQELNHNLIFKNINTLDKDFKYNSNDDFIAYTSSGYYKKNLDLLNPIFENEIYNNYLSIDVLKLYLHKLKIKKESNKIRIKLICDYTSSFHLCSALNKMNMDSLEWNNLEFTFQDDFIDYFVILNGLFEDTYFIPSLTILFITKDKIKPIDYINNNFYHIEIL